MEVINLDARIIKLEISFFKSFAGINKFNYFDLLNVVNGLNGSGKSNFLEAITFCFNENLQKLRVGDIKQLVHPHIDQSDKTYVKCTFLFTNETEKSFTREINTLSSNYLINDQAVREKKYVEELINIGINVKNNVVVYQEDIQAIASLGGKQLTNLFERVSGSISSRQEYQRLQKGLEEARLDKKILFDEKKKLLISQKRLKDLSKSNRILLGLQQQYENYLAKFILANLYLLEEKIHLAEELVKKLKERKEKQEKKIKKNEQNLKPLKKFVKDLEKKKKNFELESSKSYCEKAIAKAKIEELEEQIIKDEKKIKSAKKSLEKAQELDEARIKSIKELEEALKTENDKKEEFLASTIQDWNYWEKLKQQEKEYRRLKTVVLEKTAPIVRALDTLELQRGEINNRRANLQRQLNDVNDALEKQTGLLLKEDNERKQIINKIAKIHKELEEVRQDRNKLKLDIEASEKQQEELMAELEKVNEELHFLKLDKSQAERAIREEEALKFLRKSIDGVFGRMYQECRPVHNRFKIPMAKVFGDFFSAIIVDTKNTAIRCVELLEDNCLTYEKFLPLDSLKVSELQERLRNPKIYDGKKNVKLLYDVLKFPPKISKAVLFVTKNTLVCETAKDASYVAYDLKSKGRYDCVSLDGTFYRKNGSFSGGKSSAGRRAQLLDSQESKNLTARKEEIVNAIKNGQKYSESRYELEILELRYNKLKNWEVKYLEDACMRKESTCDELRKSISELTDKKKEIQLQYEETQEGLEKFTPQWQELQNQIAPIEKEVYKEFCENLGIESVNEYVNQLQLRGENTSMLRKIEERIGRIESCIEYESSKNTSNNVKRWSEIVETSENDLRRKKIELDKLSDNFEALKRREVSDTQKVDSITKKLESSINEFKKLEADIERIRDKIREKLSQIEDPHINGANLKADYHGFILKAKNENIELPLVEDSAILENLYELIETVEPEDYDSQKLEEIYELEHDLKFNYDSLLEDLPEGGNIEEELPIAYEEKLDNLRQKLISVPANFTVEAELDEVKKQLDQNNEQHKEILKNIRKLGNAFEKIQKLRYDTFMECFESVREKLDGVYKTITGCDSAQAYLLPINPEEPYLDEIRFKFVPPFKENRGPIEASGGEKTLAALSLLFSIHGDKHVPLFLLDEVDADLDNTNVKSIIRYLREAKNNQQIIFISHNLRVSSCADRAFGFYTSIQADNSVRTKYISINLNKYKDN